MKEPDGSRTPRTRPLAASRRRRPGRTAAAVSLALALVAIATPWAPRAGVLAGDAPTSVIILEQPGRHQAAVRLTEGLGGHVGRRLEIVGGFAAEIPGRAVEALRASPVISAVVADRKLRLLSMAAGSGSGEHAEENTIIEPGSMAFTARLIGARDAWEDHITGDGVDIALVDSGVSGVEGLTTKGKVVNGPDLSFDLQAGAAPYLDTFGHGTHLAGIMAGRDRTIERGHGPGDGEFGGIAPDARVVSVKVAGASGQTDVSQVIAAIDWVVQNRKAGGLNIRVLNLAFGTDGTQDYRVDPLAHAVEVAWRSGIVVVVAAGNTGGIRTGLANPAYDPYVIAVGADDPLGTSGTTDDAIPAWSDRGDGIRNPDLVAPGVSIRSLRVPGSSLDQAVPATSAGGRFIGGSGTSQAAAIVSGAVALLLEDRPDLTPDQVKALLTTAASPLPQAGPEARGAGLIDVEAALKARAPSAAQTWDRSTGTGSLEAARGSIHVALDGATLDGERDVFGAAWDGPAWAGLSARAAAWDGGIWNGNAWSGSGWSGLSWSGLSWSGLSWSGLSWSGLSWSGLSWSGLSWSGLSWSGQGWVAAGSTQPAPDNLGEGDSSWSTAGWDAD